MTDKEISARNELVVELFEQFSLSLTVKVYDYIAAEYYIHPLSDPKIFIHEVEMAEGNTMT